MTLKLVGQSELWDRLQLQAYAAIRQRIDIQCKISQMVQPRRRPEGHTGGLVPPVRRFASETK